MKARPVLQPDWQLSGHVSLAAQARQKHTCTHEAGHQTWVLADLSPQHGTISERCLRRIWGQDTVCRVTDGSMVQLKPTWLADLKAEISQRSQRRCCSSSHISALVPLKADPAASRSPPSWHGGRLPHFQAQGSAETGQDDISFP